MGLTASSGFLLSKCTRCHRRSPHPTPGGRGRVGSRAGLGGSNAVIPEKNEVNPRTLQFSVHIPAACGKLSARSPSYKAPRCEFGNGRSFRGQAESLRPRYHTSERGFHQRAVWPPTLSRFSWSTRPHLVLRQVSTHSKTSKDLGKLASNKFTIGEETQLIPPSPQLVV